VTEYCCGASNARALDTGESVAGLGRERSFRNIRGKHGGAPSMSKQLVDIGCSGIAAALLQQVNPVTRESLRDLSRREGTNEVAGERDSEEAKSATSHLPFPSTSHSQLDCGSL
jgi:hypothetical protein